MVFEKVNLGRLIKDEVKRQKMSFASFGNRIGIKRQNVETKVFSNETLDTGLLMQISEVLNFNFFKYYYPIGYSVEVRNERDYMKPISGKLTLEFGEKRKEQVFKFEFGENNIEIFNK